MQSLNNNINTKSCTNFEKRDPRLRHAFFSTTFFLLFLYNKNTITHLFCRFQLNIIHVYLPFITFFDICSNTIIQTFYIESSLRHIILIIFTNILKHIHLITSIFVLEYRHLFYKHIFIHIIDSVPRIISFFLINKVILFQFICPINDRHFQFFYFLIYLQ